MSSLLLLRSTGDETGGYTELGVDAQNFTHVPMYTGRAPRTHMRVGHPVVATGGAGAELVFIQVTRLLTPADAVGVKQHVFHVAVNNPADEAVSVTLTSSFPEVRETPFGGPFCTKSDRFTKTGSGQTCRETLKKRRCLQVAMATQTLHLAAGEHRVLQ